MAATRSRSRLFDPKVILNFNDIEKPVLNHLKNVYASLSIGLLSCALAAYSYVALPILRYYTGGTLLLSLIMTVGGFLYLSFTEHKPENMTSRFLAFLAFSFSSGLGLGPAVFMTLHMNPDILPTALLGSTLIFVSFTLASLYSQRRSMLFLGGILMSTMLTMSVFGLMNIFIRSSAIYQIELYVGLLVFCGFVLFDTQVICEKRRLGDTDFIWHSLDLFMDFVEIFRHLLVILNQKRNRRNSDD